MMITITLLELHEFNCSATSSTFAEIFGEHLAEHHWKTFASNNYQLPLHKMGGAAMVKVSEYIAAKRPIEASPYAMVNDPSLYKL